MTAAPQQLDLAQLPVNANRRQLAEIITRYFFKVSPRSLERWPLSWRNVNGQAICRTADALEEARRRLEAAPVIRSGQSNARSS
jgi:hypothetical protein